MTGPVLQWQMVSSDPERSAGFYSKVFGWKIDRANALGYRTVDSGEGGAPGGIWPASPGGSSFVQLFLGVPDVDDAVARAQAQGATVIVPKSVLPDGDVMAVLRDPVGTTFGVFQRGARAGGGRADQALVRSIDAALRRR